MLNVYLLCHEEGGHGVGDEGAGEPVLHHLERRQPRALTRQARRIRTCVSHISHITLEVFVDSPANHDVR